MEYRLIGNENPLGSRRGFEERVNLHLRFGWAPQGGPVAASAQAGDWGQGVPRSNKESLFVFQGLVHGRGEALTHIKELAGELRSLESLPEADRKPAQKRRLTDLYHYLETELDYHADLFPDKEAQEDGGEILVSKERLKKAIRAVEEAKEQAKKALKAASAVIVEEGA